MTQELPITAATVETILYVPPSTLLDSPFQPRHIYNEAKLREGAETMKPPHGRMLQPIVVRELAEPPRPLFAGGVDTIHDREIVFGHRRKRMALIAELQLVPIIVRQMTDEQVKYAQIVENLQRDDVHAIEEAEGLDKLMKEHGKSADQIAAETGMSRSYIYSRLKLLQAIPEVRKACIEGEFGSEVALLIARLRHPKIQERALRDIKAKNFSLADGGKESFRRIRNLLVERYTLRLSAAIFPTDSESLLKDAGACSTCPKRSGNAHEFQDVVHDKREYYYAPPRPMGADVCTDPDCFAAKKSAHLKNQANELAEKHKGSKAVLDGNKAMAAIGADGKVKGAYIAVAEVKAQLSQARAAAQKNPKVVPPLVTIIQDPRTGKTVEAVKISELVAAGVRKEEVQSTAASSQAKRQQQANEQHERNVKRADTATSVHMEILGRVRKAADTRPRDAEDLKIVTTVALQGIRHGDRQLLAQLWGLTDFVELLNGVGSMPIEKLHTLLLDCALVHGVAVHYHDLDRKPTYLLNAAKRYGVSLAPATDSAPTPSTAAQSAGEGKPAATKASFYRNAATGETWSGRGLMPKWLKAAIAGGAKLEDFAATPSKAARTPERKTKPAAQLDLVDQAQQPGQEQAGSAGKDEGAAGDAGGSDATSQANEPAEV